MANANLWIDIEDILKIRIIPAMVILLEKCSYDNIRSIRTLKRADIRQIESFFSMNADCINLKRYQGLKTKILLPGDVKLLEEIIDALANEVVQERLEILEKEYFTKDEQE